MVQPQVLQPDAIIGENGEVIANFVDGAYVAPEASTALVPAGTTVAAESTALVPFAGETVVAAGGTTIAGAAAAYVAVPLAVVLGSGYAIYGKESTALYNQVENAVQPDGKTYKNFLGAEDRVLGNADMQKELIAAGAPVGENGRISRKTLNLAMLDTQDPQKAQALTDKLKELIGRRQAEYSKVEKDNKPWLPGWMDPGRSTDYDSARSDAKMMRYASSEMDSWKENAKNTQINVPATDEKGKAAAVPVNGPDAANPTAPATGRDVTPGSTAPATGRDATPGSTAPATGRDATPGSPDGNTAPPAANPLDTALANYNTALSNNGMSDKILTKDETARIRAYGAANPDWLKAEVVRINKGADLINSGGYLIQLAECDKVIGVEIDALQSHLKALGAGQMNGKVDFSALFDKYLNNYSVSPEQREALRASIVGDPRHQKAWEIGQLSPTSTPNSVDPKGKEPTI